MTLDDFIAQWNGKGLDFDHAYGNQCMDVFEQYNQDVVGAPVVYGNAVDVWMKFSPKFYFQIPNTLTGIPEKGDVVVWGTSVGQYGHVAIFVEGDQNTFTSFDENWPIPAAGSGTGVCHLQQHSYVGVLGWLRPMANIPPTPPPTPPTPPGDVITDPQARIDLGDPDGVQELQAVKSRIHDLEKTVIDQQHSTEVLTSQIQDLDLKLSKTQVDNQTLSQKVIDLNNQLLHAKVPQSWIAKLALKLFG